MTQKIYKTARGKTVDLGALILQNENVRAVGNMNVNARGDLVDSADRVIDSKTQQIQRQNQRQAKGVAQARTVHSGTRAAKMQQVKQAQQEVKDSVLDTASGSEPTVHAGLAAAIARTRKAGSK